MRKLRLVLPIQHKHMAQTRQVTLSAHGAISVRDRSERFIKPGTKRLRLFALVENDEGDSIHKANVTGRNSRRDVTG